MILALALQMLAPTDQQMERAKTEVKAEAEIAALAEMAEFRPLVAQFARCIAERGRIEASDFVLRKNVEWTTAGKRTVRKLIDKRCVPSQVTQAQVRTLEKLMPDILRPVIADALVRLEFPASDPSLIVNAQPLPSAGLVESLWPGDDCKKCSAELRKEREEAKRKAAASMAPYIFAECAVRADPSNAHGLLMANVNSANETSAFAAMAPAFSQCVAADAKINSSRTALRGLIALSYYRLAYAPRVAAAAAGVIR